MQNEAREIQPIVMFEPRGENSPLELTKPWEASEPSVAAADAVQEPDAANEPSTEPEPPSGAPTAQKGRAGKP